MLILSPSNEKLALRDYLAGLDVRVRRDVVESVEASDANADTNAEVNGRSGDKKANPNAQAEPGSPNLETETDANSRPGSRDPKADTDSNGRGLRSAARATGLSGCVA